MCLVRCTAKLVLFVFSSCAGRWLADPVTFDAFGCGASRRYYAHGCFCWQVCYEDDAEMLLVLDARRMEFSVVDLPPPPGPDMRQVATVEAGEGRLGMLTIDRSKRGAHRLLYAVHSSKDGNGANQWQSKPAIPLPENYRYCICIRGVAGGYLLLTGRPENNRAIVDYFSLDLQTLQAEWFCQTGDYVIIGDLYADLPPSLSPPTL
ncbi:unnamed protein product [Triticum turgidum subsp. durum]|uniref:Uncharacterized protein n=1 Tax=Triticum turgidum subsp. durum TaxID=4567 RepID=A0A9R0W4U4_TRITD|nr:unnamed protein product [Triticum turgidum subsp. durum]